MSGMKPRPVFCFHCQEDTLFKPKPMANCWVCPKGHESATRLYAPNFLKGFLKKHRAALTGAGAAAAGLKLIIPPNTADSNLSDAYKPSERFWA